MQSPQTNALWRLNGNKRFQQIYVQIGYKNLSYLALKALRLLLKPYEHSSPEVEVLEELCNEYVNRHHPLCIYLLHFL